jgi:hypothetical protein
MKAYQILPISSTVLGRLGSSTACVANKAPARSEGIALVHCKHEIERRNGQLYMRDLIQKNIAITRMATTMEPNVLHVMRGKWTISYLVIKHL